MSIFKNRSTADLVVIILSVTVGFVIVITVVGILTLKIMHPEADTKNAAGTIREMVVTIIAALVGYIGGRATEKMKNGNGNTPKHDNKSTPRIRN